MSPSSTIQKTSPAQTEPCSLAARLREAEERLRFVMDATSDGVWEWVAARDEATWSERLYAMLGMPPESGAPNRDELLAMVHPDDRAALKACFARSLVSDEPHVARLRLRRADGEYLEVLLRGRTQFGPDRRPIRTFGTVTDLTAVLEAERANQRVERQSRWSAALLEAQVNSSLDGILIVDAAGRKVLQNRRMGEVWGIPDEVVNDLDDSRQVRFVTERAQDPETFLRVVKAVYANPTVVQRDEVALKNGVVLDRHTAPALGSDGTVYGRIWTFRDITDRIRSQAALRDNEERLQRLMESMPQIVWTCLPDGWNLYFNHRWAEYTGLGMAESAGLAWQQAFHPDDGDAGSHATREAVPYEVECRLRGADGLYRWFLVRGVPVKDANGEVAHWFGTCTDIDDLKLSEELLREAQGELETRVEQRTRELEAATQEAERANLAKSEFLSRMSHELRTPLNAILGFGQLLKLDELNPDQEESVDQIMRGGAHLLKLINEVLDLSGIESGKLTLSKEPVDVPALVREAFAMVGPLAAASDISLELAPATEDGSFALADHQKLLQVAINLVSNATKYNRPGGKVRVEVQSVDGGRRLLVEDDGIGIPEEKWDRLFNPFDRLGAQNTEVEGTGLGLALSRRLVEAMDGAIGLLPRPRGTCFYIDLPAAQSPLRLLDVEAPETEAVPAPEVGAADVLLVEDNPANVELMRRVLRARPEVRLRVAKRGDEALAMARERLPALVLLDMDLPDMNGLEVLRRLHQDAPPALLPVLILSADANPAHVRRALEAGATDYLTKPYDVRTLLARLAELTAEPPSRQAA